MFTQSFVAAVKLKKVVLIVSFITSSSCVHHYASLQSEVELAEKKTLFKQTVSSLGK